MKVLLVKILFLVIILSPAKLKGEIVDSVTIANELYESGEFYNAVDIYQGIVDSGYESSVLYYNLANSYFKTDRLAHSIYYYEKAKMLDPSDEDINYNLKLAKSRLVDKVEVLPQFFLKRWISNFRNKLPVRVWAIIGLSLFTISIILIIVYFFSSVYSVRRSSLIAGIIILLFSVFIIINSRRQYQQIYKSNYAIIFEPSVTAWSSPNAETQLFVIHEGLKVEVIREEGVMSEIKLPDGKKGWIKTDFFKKL